HAGIKPKREDPRPLKKSAAGLVLARGEGIGEARAKVGRGLLMELLEQAATKGALGSRRGRRAFRGGKPRVDVVLLFQGLHLLAGSRSKDVAAGSQFLVHGEGLLQIALLLVAGLSAAGFVGASQAEADAPRQQR